MTPTISLQHVYNVQKTCSVWVESLYFLNLVTIDMTQTLQRCWNAHTKMHVWEDFCLGISVLKAFVNTLLKATYVHSVLLDMLLLNQNQAAHPALMTFGIMQGLSEFFCCRLEL